MLLMEMRLRRRLLRLWLLTNLLRRKLGRLLLKWLRLQIRRWLLLLLLLLLLRRRRWLVSEGLGCTDLGQLESVAWWLESVA